MTEKVLFLCKSLYNKGIYPTEIFNSDDSDCKSLIELASQYSDEKVIAGFLREYQYRVDLIFSHLILEYFDNISDSLKKIALETIKRYSETPLNQELAAKEKQWLLDNPTVSSR